MRRLALGIVGFSLVMAITGFVLPWVSVDVRAPAPGGRELGGRLGRVTLELRQGSKRFEAAWPAPAEFPRQIRGIEVPAVLCQDQTRVAAALMELLASNPPRLRLKALAVLLVPLAVLAGGCLVLWRPGQPALTGSVAAVSAAIAAAGFRQLHAPASAHALLAVAVEPGAWLSLGAYAMLAVGAGWCTLMRRAHE